MSWMMWRSLAFWSCQRSTAHWWRKPTSQKCKMKRTSTDTNSANNQSNDWNKGKKAINNSCKQQRAFLQPGPVGAVLVLVFFFCRVEMRGARYERSVSLLKTFYWRGRMFLLSRSKYTQQALDGPHSGMFLILVFLTLCCRNVLAVIPQPGLFDTCWKQVINGSNCTDYGALQDLQTELRSPSLVGSPNCVLWAAAIQCDVNERVTYINLAGKYCLALSLLTLCASDQRLSGVLPTSITSLSKLTYINLSGNNIRGALVFIVHVCASIPAHL